MIQGNKEKLSSYKIILEKSTIDHANAVAEYKISSVNYDAAVEKYISVENKFLDGKRRINSIFNAGSILDTGSYESLVLYCNSLSDEKGVAALEVSRMENINELAKNNLIFFANYVKKIERIIEEISEDISIEIGRRSDADLNDIFLMTRFGK